MFLELDPPAIEIVPENDPWNVLEIVRQNDPWSVLDIVPEIDLGIDFGIDLGIDHWIDLGIDLGNALENASMRSGDRTSIHKPRRADFFFGRGSTTWSFSTVKIAHAQSVLLSNDISEVTPLPLRI